MKVQVSIPIKASKESIWNVISDIENAEKNISGIEKVEVLEKPDEGLNGLKWRETRTMFGKEATEVMWITDSQPNRFYKTRAESHGMIYVSTMEIESGEYDEVLTMKFEGEAQSFMGKLMSTIFAPLMNSSTKKAMFKDLEDIKKIAEH